MNLNEVINYNNSILIISKPISSWKTRRLECNRAIN